MSANVNAQLGLLITASDKASPIFEQLARNIMNAFQGVQDQTVKLNEGISQIGKGVNVSQATSGVTVVGNESEKTSQKVGKLSGIVSNMAKISAWQDLGARGEHIGKSIAGGIWQAIDSASSFQQQIGATAATLNNRLPDSAKLSSQAIKALNDKALEMGKSGFFSANQIAEGMYTLARQGIDYKDIYGGAMESVQNLAVATDSNLSDTANVVSDIVHEMGGEMKQEFGDNLQAQFNGTANMISGAMHNARMTMDDFLGTLKMVGPQASTMGMGIRDVSTAIALLGEHGIKATQAGTTLRRMLTNLAAPTKAAKTEMEHLGIIVNGQNQLLDQSTGKLKSFTDIQSILHDKLKGLSQAQQEAALKTMFGQYALSGMNVIAGASAEDVAHLSHEVTSAGTAQELANQKWDNTAGHLRRLKAHFETLVKQIGEELLPTFSKFLTYGDKILSWVDSLSPSTQVLLAKIVMLTGAFALIGGKVASMIASFGMLKIAFGSLFQGGEVAEEGTKVVGVLGRIASMLGLSALAFTGILAVIAAVGVGLYELYQHSTTFRNGVNAAFKAVVDFVKTELYPPVKEILGKMKDFIDAVWPDIKTIATGVLESLKAFWDTFWPGLSTGCLVILRVFVVNFKVVLDTIMGVIRIGLALITGDWKNAWNGLKTMVWNILNDILSIFGTSGSKLWNAGANLIKSFVDGWKNFHIPMPHFKIAGSFSLNPPSIPSVGVDWYAKGGIFNSPQMIGVGESGSEAVLPLNKLQDILNLDKLAQGVASKVGKHVTNNITVNVQGGKHDKDLANQIARQVRLQIGHASI